MDSAGHRGNILSKQFREAGVGVARDERGLAYFTVIFGTPARP
jgi:uncharacterized protein YkwD